MVEIVVVSDVICPWCYVGQHRLMTAMTRCQSKPVALIWQPFQLNPDMPKSGMERAFYLARKFGGSRRAKDVYSEIERQAAKDGLHVNFDAIKRTPNTLDAHRLIFWSRMADCQNEVVTALFRAYFCEGRDVGTTQVLAEIADNAGMDPDDTIERLTSDADREHVASLSRHHQTSGINGVPVFLLDGRILAHGAQPTSFWDQVIPALAGYEHPTVSTNPG